MKRLILLMSLIISSLTLCLAQNSRIIDRGNYLELILGDSAKIVSAKANVKLERPADISQRLYITMDGFKYTINATTNTVPGITNSWGLYANILSMLLTSASTGNATQTTQLALLQELQIANDTLSALYRNALVKDSLKILALDSLVRNTDTLIRNTDTIKNYLYQIKLKQDTSNLLLTEIRDSIGSLKSYFGDLLKEDCTGSNETYYINGQNTISINSSEICSYSITVIEDEVVYRENGITSPFNLPVSYNNTVSFKQGTKYLLNPIQFTGLNLNSKAIIKVIK